LHGDVRKTSRTAVGDRVRVEIDFDASYRNGPQHPMPQWFRRALDGNPQAMKNWTVLIPSRKKEILRYFSHLKSEDARARNLTKALRVLSGETGRFMARLWKNGS
jgi:Bacteriocin-protection, YdeI or OmpD-Associated